MLFAENSSWLQPMIAMLSQGDSMLFKAIENYCFAYSEVICDISHRLLLVHGLKNFSWRIKTPAASIFVQLDAKAL